VLKTFLKQVKLFLGNLKKKLISFFSIIGPGFITGASDDDPGGIGTSSMAGAKYGLSLSWVLLYQLPFVYFIQEMCARIGVVTKQGLTANLNRFLPKKLVLCAVFFLLFANIINIAADISIMASCAKLIWGLNPPFWALTLTSIIVLMEVFLSYRIYSIVLSSFALVLISYVITAFMLPLDWGEISSAIFIPSFKFERDYLFYSLGLIGTTISPYLFFWQSSQEIEQLNEHERANMPVISKSQLINNMRIDTFLGMLFSQIVTIFVMITCYYTLHKSGITEITSAFDAAIALKPLAGNWAGVLFSLGILGAGFLGIPVLAGSSAYALCELRGYQGSLNNTYRQSPFFYGIIIFSTFIGLVINFININPLKALLYSAVINSIAAAPIIICIIILANKIEIMGEHKNGFASNFFSTITFLIMLLSCIVLFLPMNAAYQSEKPVSKIRLLERARPMPLIISDRELLISLPKENLRCPSPMDTVFIFSAEYKAVVIGRNWQKFVLAEVKRFEDVRPSEKPIAQIAFR